LIIRIYAAETSNDALGGCRMCQLLKDPRFYIYVCSQLIEEIRNVAGREKLSPLAPMVLQCNAGE